MSAVLNETDTKVLDRYYSKFDADNNGNIDFTEFVHGVCLLTKGDVDDKLKFIFECYDLDGNGTISKDELRHWIKSIFGSGLKVVQELCTSLNVTIADNDAFTAETLKIVVNKCFEEIDTDHSDTIELEEFITWAKNQKYVSLDFSIIFSLLLFVTFLLLQISEWILK